MFFEYTIFLGFYRKDIPLIAIRRCSDLYDVPTSLRTVLEGLLAEDPSPAVLARYSPRIRKIIVELLQGLQRKQTPYWSAIGRTKDNGYLSPVPATSMRDR